MKNIVANNRVMVGDTVAWVAKSGKEYDGKIVNIKEGASDDLIIVDIGNGECRSFYDCATDYYILQGIG